MFAWITAGMRTFKSVPEDMFEKTKDLAANQGLYNGFLSVGLIWSLSMMTLFAKYEQQHLS
jgi:putative membrane protein